MANTASLTRRSPGGQGRGYVTIAIHHVGRCMTRAQHDHTCTICCAFFLELDETTLPVLRSPQPGQQRVMGGTLQEQRRLLR